MLQAAILFAAGIAWKSVLLVIVFGTFDWNPRDTLTGSIGTLWVTTLLCDAFLLLMIYLGMQLKEKVRRDGYILSIFSEYSETAKKAIEQSIDLMISWGITYAIASINVTAVESSLPEGKTYQIIYAFLSMWFTAMLVGVISGGIFPSVTSCLVNLFGKKREEIANTVFNGSVWANTVVWANTISYLLDLHNILEKDRNVAFFWLYNIIFILFAVASSLLFRRFLTNEHTNLKDIIGDKKLDIEDEEDVNLMEQIEHSVDTLKENWFFLYTKSMAMISIATISNASYVSLLLYLYGDKISISQPLPLGPATTFFLIVILLISAIGLAIEKCIAMLLATTRITFEKDEDEDFSDSILNVFNDFTEEVIHFWGLTFTTGLSWLAGNSFHSWAYSMWTLLTSTWLHEDQLDERILLTLLYAMLLTIVYVLFSARIANQADQKINTKSPDD